MSGTSPFVSHSGRGHSEVRDGYNFRSPGSPEDAKSSPRRVLAGTARTSRRRRSLPTVIDGRMQRVLAEALHLCPAW
eukprot:scaffold303_cov410-Prasinococcus_capsulatus_cf.AAC.4